MAFENGSELTGAFGVEVLGHYEGSGEVLGQGPHQVDERLNPPCRRANNDKLTKGGAFGGVWHSSRSFAVRMTITGYYPYYIPLLQLMV
jgi:hypothetical protein